MFDPWILPNTQIRPFFNLSGKGCQGHDALSIQNALAIE
jgi:hypothetical protein